MSTKKRSVGIKISDAERSFLTENKIRPCDVWHYAMLQLMRVVPDEGIPRCIYVHKQRTQTASRAAVAVQGPPRPRTCADICGPLSVDPAACVSLIDAAEPVACNDN